MNQLLAYTTDKVVAMLLDSFERFPTARNVATLAKKNLRQNALCSTDTLAMLDDMERYERVGYLPVEALELALIDRED